MLARLHLAGFAKLLVYLRPYWKGMAISVSSGTFHHLFAIAGTALAAYLVGLAATGGGREQIWPFLPVLALLVTLRVIMYFTDMYVAHEVAFRILVEFRIKIYQAVERVAPAYLLNMRSGQLASTLMADTEVLEWFFAHTAGSFLVAVLVSLVTLVMLGLVHWLLPLAVLPWMIVLFSVPFWLRTRADRQGRDTRDKLAEINSEAVDGVQGLREILCIGYSKKNENYWQGRSGSYSKHILGEMNSFKKDAWTELIDEHRPPGKPLKVLDIGTGPGFFALLLSGMGHRVTAIDCTDNMLAEAENNVRAAGYQVEFYNMDSHQLDFAGGTFDLIICRNLTWTLRDPIKDALARLEQAGIPVLFVDFYMEPMTNSTKSMLLLGEIMGEKQRAQEIVDFYNDQVDVVYSRLAGINGNKPDVYIECASKGPDDYGISYGNVGWGSIVTKAGGNNIAEPPLGEKSEALSPEYLVDNSPDIIILTGRHWSTPGSLRLGYVTSPDEARSSMEPFIRRPGWNTIDAVKNNRNG
ncbi:methyltransferase domain-containing protein [Desulfoscipio geothermicus]|nr:methyltransferase domain-containing protein [Desulfoscipio geothermicus]